MRVQKLTHDARVQLVRRRRIAARHRVMLAHVHEQVVATRAAVFAHDARVQPVGLRVAVLHAHVLVQVDQLRETHRAEVAREQLLLVAEVRLRNAAPQVRFGCHESWLWFFRGVLDGAVFVRQSVLLACPLILGFPQFRVVLRPHVASNVLFLRRAVVAQLARERSLARVRQEVSLQSTLTVRHEAALFTVQLQLWAALVELLVLSQVLARHRREATVGAAHRRRRVVETDLMLALHVHLQVRIDAGALVVAVRASDRLLL